MKLFTACFLFLYLCGTMDGQRLDCGNQKKDLIFLLDESSSIRNGVFNFQLRPFLIDVIGCYNLSADAIQMSLTSFSTFVEDRWQLDTYNDNVEAAQNFTRAFSRAASNSQTNTDKALQFVRENIIGSAADRPDVPNCVIIITDGSSTSPGDTTSQKDLLRMDIDECFVIGFGSRINETEIDLLASRPLVDYKFLAVNAGDLARFKDIFAAFPCPPCNVTCLNDGFCVRENQTCLCNENYTGEVCETRIC